MTQLLIKYRFQGLPYMVADGKGVFYQLPHLGHKHTKAFRKLNLVLNNGITEGYRINRTFISLHQLRIRAYTSNEVVVIEDTSVKLPF